MDGFCIMFGLFVFGLCIQLGMQSIASAIRDARIGDKKDDEADRSN